jgi:hypothetical protein
MEGGDLRGFDVISLNFNGKIIFFLSCLHLLAGSCFQVLRCGVLFDSVERSNRLVLVWFVGLSCFRLFSDFARCLQPVGPHA